MSVGAEHHVHVAVEETGQDPLPAHVDALVAVELRADVDDAAVLDEHVTLRRGCTGAVEDRPAVEDRACHGRTLTLPRAAAGNPDRSGRISAR